MNFNISRTKFTTHFTRALSLGLVLVAMQLANAASAQSLTELERSHATLQAAFDLVIKQLGERDRVIEGLRADLASARAGADGVPLKLLGCAVDQVNQQVAAESFIYDRDKVFLGWLKNNVSTCKMSDLEDLERLATDFSLRQSGSRILLEMERRGKSVPDDATLGVPLPS